MYNLTGLTGANGIGDLLTFTNTVSGGMFVGMLLVAIFAIMVLALRRYGLDNAFLSSSWVCFLLSLLLRSANLLDIKFMLGFLIAAAGITLYKITVKPSNY